MVGVAMSEFEIKVHVRTDENVHKWDLGAVLDGVLSWHVEELPEEFEPRCDECGSVQDEDTTEWCGECGCCKQHCQDSVDCNEEPVALECDDCGIEDGARWDIGPNNQWSVCTGCKDSYGYDN